MYFLVGVVLGTAFGLYLWTLYDQLTLSFENEEQQVPTRIYSDMTRIAPLQPRSFIEERLKGLGYSADSTSDELRFYLHPADYPLGLLPEDHPLLHLFKNSVSSHSALSSSLSPEITLHFQGKGPKAPLESISLENQTILDLYLEPELTATLTRSGDFKREIRTYLKFDEIPANVWKAIISIEDQHFLDHKGLDPKGIARALWVNLKTLSFAQGGSTITQQLVKNLMTRRTKNIFRKMNELFLSLLLEARFEKEEILERYLNEVYLGQIGNLEIHGVAQGAEHFFGKKLDQLNLAEIALMAGLIRGPGYYSPYRYQERALERQRLILRKMVETGQIAQAEAKAALRLPIRLAPPKTSANKAPFFTDYVKAELIGLLRDRMSEAEITQSGFRVYTTLDPSLNSIAQQSISEGLSSLEKKLKASSSERLEGALACVDPTTGFIRALVGGRNYSQSNFNRILNMKRQVGSTFKPIVYLSALQKGFNPHGIPWGPAYPVQDAPWTLVFDEGRQTWSPKNYERGYLGWISLRTALAQSINTVAARLGHEIGIPSLIATAKSLGIESDLPQVPSLSLGVANLSPIELLRVYSTLANRGVLTKLSVIRSITDSDSHPFMQFIPDSNPNPKDHPEPGPFDLLTDLLQSVFSEGTARGAKKLGFDRPAAGKTGTTNDHRDAWFAGYTPQLTTVVWVGLDQTSYQKPPTLQLTGSNSALPIWVSFMKKGLAFQPVLSFAQSPFLTEIEIDRYTGQQALPDCPASQVVHDKYFISALPRLKTCEKQWPSSENKTEK